MKQLLSFAIMVILIAAVFSGCGRLPDEQLLDKGKKYEQDERFEDAVQCYLKLEEEYPDSPLRAEALYQAGRVYTYGLKEYDTAIELFKRAADEFTGTETGAQCQFMVGFIYANNEVDTAKARIAYQDFVNTYPDHDLADDVQWELKNLGKDINEIIHFEN